MNWYILSEEENLPAHLWKSNPPQGEGWADVEDASCEAFDRSLWWHGQHDRLPSGLKTLFLLCRDGYVHDGDCITVIHGATPSERMVAAQLSGVLLAIWTKSITMDAPTRASLGEPMEIDWSGRNRQSGWSFGNYFHLQFAQQSKRLKFPARFILPESMPVPAAVNLAHFLGRTNRAGSNQFRLEPWANTALLTVMGGEVVTIPDGYGIRG